MRSGIYVINHCDILTPQNRSQFTTLEHERAFLGFQNVTIRNSKNMTIEFRFCVEFVWDGVNFSDRKGGSEYYHNNNTYRYWVNEYRPYSLELDSETLSASNKSIAGMA